MRNEVRAARNGAVWIAVAGLAVASLSACNRAQEPADAPAAASQPAASQAPRDMGSDAADEYEAMRAAQTATPAAPGVKATIPAGDATITVDAPAQ